MIETPSLAPGAYAATLDGVGLLVEVEDNNTLGQATALVLAEDPAGSGLAQPGSVMKHPENTGSVVGAAVGGVVTIVVSIV